MSRIMQEKWKKRSIKLQNDREKSRVYSSVLFWLSPESKL